ncbi:MAG: hypothetical protein LQ338_003526 [Usnochroma carphineum]|nr:MAG: hypothetical protein LQ338_003526 [Usnochroma carphineum]
MPKAAKAKTNTTKSQSNPLGARSANVPKKAPSRNSKAAQEKPSPSSNDLQPTSAPDNSAAQDERTETSHNTPSTSRQDDERNYLLHVMNTLTSDPAITRILSIPPSLTFGTLHHVLQIAFGWAGCHSWSWSIEVSTPVNDSGRNDSSRRKISLPKTVMVLNPGHSVDMDLGDTDVQDENRWTLRDVFEKKEWDGTAVASGAELQIIYEYDHGDSWEHQITLLGRAEKGLHSALTGLPVEKAQKVLCISGEGHPCAEDCGSAPGWEDLKKEFKKQRGGDKDLREWYKHQCANGDSKGLDPYKWDLMDVNADLETIKI